MKNNVSKITPYFGGANASTDFSMGIFTVVLQTLRIRG